MDANRPPPNPFLAAGAVIMIAVGAIGLFTGVNAPACATFAFLGFAMGVISVFEPRMEGRQRLGVTRVDINLRKIKSNVKDAEIELKKGQVSSVDDVVNPK